MNNNNHKINVPYNDKLYDLLEQIQLEVFWPLLRDQLQITRISHFEYVKTKDLEKIGMSKPAIRRLLDGVNKYKQANQLRKASLPPPPPPQSLISMSATRNSQIRQISFSHDLQTGSKLYNNNINKTLLTAKLLSINKKKEIKFDDTGSISTDSGVKPVSVIINPNDIEFIKSGNEILGSGNFGVVKKAVWSTHEGAKLTVAVKCLHESLIETSNQQQAFIDLVNEISCMCGLDHKNLIKLYGIVLNGSHDPSSINSSSTIMMVTELAPYGSLYNYLRKHYEARRNLPLTRLYSYAYQVASGMFYLECKRLIHRDLAARNILLYTIEHVKICDFGMTRSVKNGEYSMKESSKIPCAWYPPESIRHKLFSIKSDVWMYGVTLWEILSLGLHPWPNLTATQILNKIETEMQRLPIPNLCSKSLYRILLSCWSNDPNQRPSFQQLRHYFKEMKLAEMRAKDDFKQNNRLEIDKNDTVTIIDGSPDKYWWKGQNQRTLLVGTFPRAILDPQRKLTSEDISLPLKNSFIHTGHMSAGRNERTWGNPAKIDEIFLSNPLNPPDLLDDLNETNGDLSEKSDKNNVEIIDSIMNFNQNENLINLLDTSISEDNTQNTNYSASLDSFSSDKSKSNMSNNSSTRNFPTNNLVYVNDKYESRRVNDDYNECYNNSNIVGYLDYRAYLPDSDDSQCSSFKAITSVKQSNYKATNPFVENFLDRPDDAVNNNFLSSKNQDANKNTTSKPKFNFNDKNNKLSVDDLLNKVMNDVLNDFKNVKTSSNNN